MNAKDLGRQEEGADFQMVLIDELTNEIVVPNGTMGERPHPHLLKNGIYVLKIVLQGLKSILVYPYLIQREDADCC